MKILFVSILTSLLLSTACSQNNINKAKINTVDYTCLIADVFAQGAFVVNEAEVAAVKLAPGEVTYKEESRYGKEVYDELVKSKNFITTGYKKEKLENICRKLLNVLPVDKTDLKYKIYLIRDTLVNAFTAGGYVYVYTGLMDYCDNDNELAFIIAHEIGHNELGHLNLTLKRIKVAGQLGDVLYTVKQLTSNSFNQFNELEADCYATDLVNAGGYSPVDGAMFWKRMSKDYDDENIKFMKFFMSHPYSNERYDCLKKHIETYYQLDF